MASYMREAKTKALSAKTHVDDTLEKIRKKPWAEPLGKTLEVSSKIVEGIGGFLPGAGVIGGALSFGATLLNPAPSLQDLQKDLKQVKEALEGSGSQNEVLMRALLKEQAEIKQKILFPEAEIKDNFEEIKSEMKEILRKVGESCDDVTGMRTMKDQISQTFHLVADSRYRVSYYRAVTIVYFKNILRMGSRKLMRRMKFSFKLDLKTSSSMPLSCKPLPFRTWLQRGSRPTS